MPLLMKTRTKEWKPWRRKKSVAGGNQYEAFELGTLLPGVLDYLRKKHKVEVENTAVITTREVQRHLANKHSFAARLTEADLDRMPAIIAAPRAVLYDTKDPALLYVFDPTDRTQKRLGKVVVRVNFSVKTKFGRKPGETEKPRGERITASVVRTAGYADLNNLKEDRYELIEGELE